MRYSSLGAQARAVIQKNIWWGHVPKLSAEWQLASAKGKRIKAPVWGMGRGVPFQLGCPLPANQRKGKERKGKERKGRVFI